MLDNRSFSPESFSPDSWYFGDAPGATHPSWGTSWLGSWGQSWGPLHEVYEPPRLSGPDNAGRDHDLEQEQHFEAKRAVGQKLYAKPARVEVVSVETTSEPVPETRQQPVNVVSEEPATTSLVLLRNELDEIQQSVAAIANEAIAKAKRQADDEEALILILSQIL